MFLINLSILTGVFPTLWKISRITPLHESGSHKNIDNHRPVSILCSFSKIIERHVYNAANDFFTINNLWATT